MGGNLNVVKYISNDECDCVLDFFIFRYEYKIL